MYSERIIMSHTFPSIKVKNHLSVSFVHIEFKCQNFRRIDCIWMLDISNIH